MDTYPIRITPINITNIEAEIVHLLKTKNDLKLILHYKSYPIKI